VELGVVAIIEELEAPDVIAVVRSAREAAVGQVHEVSVDRRSIEAEGRDPVEDFGVAERCVSGDE
jgi:hypothetical protein